jgi:hypothetical protein
MFILVVIWSPSLFRHLSQLPLAYRNLGSVRSIAMWSQQAIRYITPGLLVTPGLASRRINPDFFSGMLVLMRPRHDNHDQGLDI